MTSHIPQIVVAVAGLYLVALGVTAFVRPARAKRFLEAHASSARVHFIELALRFVVGGSLVLAAPRMRGADIAQTGGWILVVTTLVLAVTPWRMHHRFAAWSVPKATRQMTLVAVGALAGGIVVLAALLLSPRVAWSSG